MTGLDLGLEEHEVTHHHRFAAHRQECSPATQCQRWLDGDTVQCHLQVGPREPVAMHLTGHGGGFSQRGIDLVPINRLSISSARKDERQYASQYLRSTHN